MNDWLSIHIYVNPPFDYILSDFISPLVENYLQNGEIISWFFIRYYDDGHHIRLRVKLRQDGSLKNEYLISEIASYLKSQRIESSKNLGEQVVKMIYTPEYERYGGKIGVKIAERLFCVSSTFVLRAIKNGELWTYNLAFLNAMLMNLVMAFVFLDKDKKSVARFFRYNCKNWTVKSIEYFTLKNKLEKSELFLAVLQEYKKKLQPQNQMIREVIDYYYELINTNSLTEKTYKYWLKECILIRKKVNQLLNRNSDFEINTISKWKILDSYVHMNNNRFGIKNKDEGFIAFLLFETLEKHRNENKN